MRVNSFLTCLAWLGGCLGVLFMSGCSEEKSTAARPAAISQGAGQMIRISGSSTMAPLITALAQDFQKLHKGVAFQIEGGGSGRALNDVKEGTTDIAMVSRELTRDEREWLPFVIARDGIAVAIHQDNPVAALTKEQVAGIYTKKILNWGQVGGREGPILVIGASPATGSTELFLHHFAVKGSDFKPDVVVDPNSDRFATLARNPNAILYSSLGESERRMLAGENVKPLPYAGIPATSDNLEAGRYSISRPLALMTTRLPTGAAKDFIDYARSRAALPTIERFEFVPYRD